MIRPDPRHFDFESDARQLAEAADHELSNLSLARAATGYLADLVWRAPGDHVPVDAPMLVLRKVCWVQLAALAVRSASAATLLLSFGYEPEAHPLHRRLLECTNACETIMADTSGQQAQRWLTNRDFGSAGRIADRLGTGDDLRFLHGNSHAGPWGINYLLVPPLGVPVPDELRSIDMRPRRLPMSHADRLLFTVAYEVMRFGGMFTEIFEVGIEIPADLMREYQVARSTIEGASPSTA